MHLHEYYVGMSVRIHLMNCLGQLKGERYV